jgi:hypothetical protein
VKEAVRVMEESILEPEHFQLTVKSFVHGSGKAAEPNDLLSYP